MRVQITIDSMVYQIDTRDPELLARWLAETFTAFPWHPSTLCRAQVYPGYVYNEGGPAQPDWIADARIVTRYTPVLSPQEFVDELQRQLDDVKALEK